MTCDVCAEPFTAEDPMMEHRTPRPSDPADMCCVVVSHDRCLGGGKTGREWEEWLDSEGRAAGFLWLS